MKKILASASLLASDLINLENEIRRCEDAGVDWIHFDVMDGRFVEQITYGAPVLKCAKKITDTPFDVHLMVEDPTKQIDFFAQAGADIITLHAESSCDVPLCLERIHILGKKAGIAIKPNTPLKKIYDLLPQCDMVLIMSVEPGYGGQGFIPETLSKIEAFRSFCDDNGYTELDIQVDGGINEQNAAEVKKAGANILVAGTSLFRAADMKAVCRALKGNLNG